MMIAEQGAAFVLATPDIQATMLQGQRVTESGCRSHGRVSKVAHDQQMPLAQYHRRP
jgi:hypothetical protein